MFSSAAHISLILRNTESIGSAGWSSPVARQAHNLKVVGSNPTPATSPKNNRPQGRFFYGQNAEKKRAALARSSYASLEVKTNPSITENSNPTPQDQRNTETSEGSNRHKLADF